MSANARKSYDLHCRSRSSVDLRSSYGGVKRTFSAEKIPGSAQFHRPSGALPKSRALSEERKSGNIAFRWSSGARKTSINFTDGKRSVKDVRPLNDKAYQRKKIAEIIEILEQENFKYPTTLSKQPSKKDFEVVFQFFVNFWEPSYEVKKLEEEAPKLLKGLRYPFAVSKSSFTYVAPTNWPQLLGVLIWLKDLYKIVINSDVKNFQLQGSESAILFDYICQCFYNEKHNEEEDKKVFTDLIKARPGLKTNELQQKKKEKNIALERVQNELAMVEKLQKDSKQHDIDIKQYDDHLLKMKSRQHSKEVAYQQLLEDLKQKEAALNLLQTELDKLKDAYDAQGFDGIRQKKYYDSQKKELLETLEQKEAELHKAENSCWESEIEFSQALDKGTSVIESFNELYANTIKVGNSIVEPLQNAKIPQATTLCRNFRLEFPDCKMLPASSAPCHSTWSAARKKALDEIMSKIEKSNVLFKRVSTTQKEKLHECLMKKHQLAVHQKQLSAEVTQMERELYSKNEKDLEDVKTIESSLEEDLKSTEELQTEKMNEESFLRELEDELAEVEALEKVKQKEINEYMREMKLLHVDYSETKEYLEKLCQKKGQNIAKHLQEAVANIVEKNPNMFS